MTNNSSLTIGNLLTNIPQSLRDELLLEYAEIVTNFRNEKWEPSELNGGKLCETVYTILRGYIDTSYPTTTNKPPNMVLACIALEQESTTFPRSVRIQIPRMLMALYEIRNNRGVGHAGGDVNPNRMDATCVLYMSKWIIAELIRIFHNVDTGTAEAFIDTIVERILPFVWKVGDKFRILDIKTTMKEKTLLLLYQRSTYLKDKDLFDWTEHPNMSNFRRDVLRPLHHEKMIEYDEENQSVHLSPLGSDRVEKIILPRMH
jgi:hypothetical protein